MNSRDVVSMPAALLDELLDSTREDLARWNEHYGQLDPHALGAGVRLCPASFRLAWVAKHLSMLRSQRTSE